MRKSFIKYLTIIMICAMVLTIGSIFILRSYSSHTSMNEKSLLKMEQVHQTILNNENEIESLKQSTNEDYLTRAKAFAYIVETNPEVIEDFEELKTIQKVLNVDQLHIIDSDGILKWGTNPEYYGFDFSESSQTAEFLPGITDKNFEYSQEAQPNGSKGDFFQYAGVARQDKPGIIQVGLRPERLEKLIKNSDLSKVLSNLAKSENISLFAIDTTNNLIISHENSELIGKSLDEIGFPSDYLDKFKNGGFYKYNGIKRYYIAKQYDNVALLLSETMSQLYADRNTQLILISIIVFIIFAVLLSFTNYLLKVQIIYGIDDIIKDLKSITGGNLNTVINVRNNPEFSSLSDNINDMVNNIKSKMNETDLLMEAQTEIIKNVKMVSADISSCSSNMLKMSEDISSGSVEQANSIEELSSTISELAQKIDDNSKVTQKADCLALECGKELEAESGKINEMLEAMNDISKTSQKIEDVVKSIEDISSQINLLALNAALEAARAGEAGRGFSVVADEVRNLANESFKAVKGTSELVTETLKTIERGTEIAKSTALTINNVMSNAKKTTSSIEEMSVRFSTQLEYINKVSSEVSEISLIVHQNSKVAEGGSELSRELDNQTQRLEEIISLN